VHPAHLRYLPTDEAHFLRAVRRGDRAEVLRCLGRAGPTVKVLLNRSVTFWGNTAVHLAFRRGDQEMVRLLLSYGADPTVVNDWDEPAIPSADEVRRDHPHTNTHTHRVACARLQPRVPTPLPLCIGPTYTHIRVCSRTHSICSSCTRQGPTRWPRSRASASTCPQLALTRSHS
jgi:hypothetical protein